MVLSFVVSGRAQVSEQVLKSFGNVSQSGVQPVGLLIGNDGSLYGVTSGGGLYSSGTVFRVNVDGSGYSVLHAFGVDTNDGAIPSTLMEGRDGMLYGTTSAGGSNALGAVFKLARDGSAFTNLYTFGSIINDAVMPAALIQGSDGALYGVAQQGGTNLSGVVFKLATDGSAYQVLYNFGNDLVSTPGGFYYGDGTTPVALTQGQDGALYGIAHQGGTNSQGALFRLASDGSSYEVIHSFGDLTNDASMPIGLAQRPDGVLLGIAQNGGASSNGAIFRVNTNGSGYSLGYSFTSALGDGANPGAGLIHGQDGSWYGTTLNGGSLQHVGTVFKLTADGSGCEIIRRFDVITSVLYDFSTDGQQPGALVQAANGQLYGFTTYGGTTGQGAYQSTGDGTIFTLSTNATGYAVIYNFSATGSDGQNPASGLTLGRDGFLYGVTHSGGPAGQGAVFKLGQNGAAYQILYGFGLDPIDGYLPEAGLFQGTDGMFYGATSQGGYGGGSGFGAIFKVSPDGSQYAEVLSFGFWAPDGSTPTAPPLQGRDGNLYGTTADGGYYSSGYGGFGIIYAVGTNGLGYTILHEFSTNNLEGRTPFGGLVQGSDGALYGTSYGGQNFEGNGPNYGTVFKLLTNGSNFQVLHTFTNNGVDGSGPHAGLTLASDGFLYGTTRYGGAHNHGTIFKLSTDGLLYQVLYNFGSITNDGWEPVAGLTQGTDGYLYGATPFGGAFGPIGGTYGTAFKIGTNGSGYTVLYSFGGTAGDGRQPAGGLTQGSDGAFYGTTSAGGTMNAGVVFRLGPTLLEFTGFNLLSDNTVALTISGAPNTTCRIDASTDLVTWVTLTNTPNPNGTVQFIDTAAPAFSRRFYRASQSP